MPECREFSGTDFNRPIDGLCLDVALCGSIPQRAAFVRNLNTKCVYAMPGIWDTAKKSSKAFDICSGFIKANITLICDYYGTTYTGNLDSIAYDMIRDYGGLSVLDWMIFFENSKRGKYKTEYQSITTRGINAEYLRDWIGKYIHEREAARIEMNEDCKNPSGGKSGLNRDISEFIEKIEKRRVIREALESDAEMLRREWQRELYDIEVGEDEYPILVSKPGSADLILRRNILEFVKFGIDEGINDLFFKVIDQIQKKYGSDFESIRDNELKVINSDVHRFIKNAKANQIIAVWYDNEHPEPEYQADHARAANIAKTVRHIEECYYSEYLPECIAEKKVPLKKQEYIIRTAIMNFCKYFENPVIKIIFE